MSITALSTQPNSVTRPTTFNTDSDTFHSELPTLITEINATAAAMTAVAAGGAVSLQYTFSTTTTDADPGAGYLRLSSATQNAATVIRADLSGSDGSVVTGVLGLIDDSTSTNKGYLTLRKATDSTKWLVFAVASVASPSGYRNITVTNAASSAASPFSNGDALLFDFTPTGDMGSTGATGANSIPIADGGGTVDAITATFSPALSLADKIMCAVVSTGANVSTTPTLAPDGGTARTIKTRGAQAMQPGDIGAAGMVAFFEYHASGTYWELINPIGASKGANTFTGTQTMSGAAVNEAATVTVASATSTAIGAAASNNVDISGTTTITSFDSVADGIVRRGRFTGVLTLTHNGTSLILPGAASITTAANDTYVARSLGGGNWIVLSYTRANGQAIVATSALVLLATLTPTAAAAVNSLNSFSATYDAYLIIGEGIEPAATDSLLMRLAVAGSLDTGGNYFRANAYSASGVASSSTSARIGLSTTIYASGLGMNFALKIINANDAVKIKSIFAEATYQSTSTPTYVSEVDAIAYTAANAITGVGFLWSGGGNFVAQGKIRIYGITNS